MSELVPHRDLKKIQAIPTGQDLGNSSGFFFFETSDKHPSPFYMSSPWGSNTADILSVVIVYILRH